jgi:cell division protein FtsZ
MAQPRPSLTLVAKGGRMLNAPSAAEAQTIQPAPQPMVMQGRDMRVQEYAAPSMPAYTAQAAVNLQQAPQMHVQPQQQPVMQPRMQPQVQAAQPSPQPMAQPAYAPQPAPEVRPAPQPRMEARPQQQIAELPFAAPQPSPQPQMQMQAPVQTAPAPQPMPQYAPQPAYYAEPAPQPQMQAPLQAPAAQAGDASPKRSGGIFSRMTSTAASWAQKTGQDLRSATPAAMMNRVSTGEPAPQRPASQPAPQQAQPRLSGLDPADRLAPRSGDDEILDIPAFLRRQAN